MQTNLLNVLGFAMTHGITPECEDALNMISVDMISDPVPREIFGTIKRLRANNIVVDMAAVEKYSQDVEFSTIATITNNATGRQVVAYARQFVRSYNEHIASEKLYELSCELATGRADVNVVLSQLERLSSNLAFSDSSKEPVRLGDLMEGYKNVLEDRVNNADSRGLDIGLDLIINRTDLIILGGQPSMGKTMLAMFILDQLDMQGNETLIFSLEMEDMDIAEREVSRAGRLSSYALKDPVKYDLNWGVAANAIGEVISKNIYIDDSPVMSISDIKSKARKFKGNHPNLSMIAIDYIGLMDLPDADRHDISIGKVSRALKQLAKELKCPVMLLSQLNRSAANAKREPMNSDLKDSGSLESDADKILFPYREEVHIPDTPNKGLCKVLKTKVRDGKLGAKLLEFHNGNLYPTDRGWIEAPPEAEKAKDKSFR